MKCLIQISVLIIAVQWFGEVKCRTFVRKKHIYKTFHLGFTPLPPKHFSLMFEKFAPFGTFEFKHDIKKRQIGQTELPSPITNEVLAVEDGPLKVPMTHLLEKKEEKDVEKLPAEVIITSVVEPVEPGKQISFLLPVDSEVLITPAIKDVVPVPLAAEVPVSPEPELKPEVVVSHSSAVVDITPEPIGILPAPEVKPVEPKVVLTTAIESTVPPVPVEKPIPLIEPSPEDKKINTPVINPVINSIPIVPLLYTNIKGIPFYTPAANIIPFITPATVSIPEAVIAPSSPPVVKEVVPVIKEEKPPVVEEVIPPVVKEEIPPVVKEEPPPNFFVKSSRFVLYFGSMMLQMLSRFVNGEINLNQMPILPPLLGVQ